MRPRSIPNNPLPKPPPGLGARERRGEGRSTPRHGALQPGPDPSHFVLACGESVTIRIVGVGTAQLETVGRFLERLEGDGPGHLYRYTADRRPGGVRHLMMAFSFAERAEPPGRYTVTVEGPGGCPRLEAPCVVQPAVGAFPQTLSYALTFQIGSAGRVTGADDDSGTEARGR